MITCRVKPTSSECNACDDVADFFGRSPNCGECAYSKRTYELVEIEHGIFNDYAYVISEGQIKRVSLNRIYDVKERELYNRDKLN